MRTVTLSRAPVRYRVRTATGSGWRELDGDAVEDGGAGERVDGEVVGEQVGVDPGVAGGNVELGCRAGRGPSRGAG